jgi:hypothetical protein
LASTDETRTSESVTVDNFPMIWGVITPIQGDSRGEQGVWPHFDYGGAITLMWWDPEAESVDEVGNAGAGSYRFANGGDRYGPGELPDSLEAAGLFDMGSSVVEYDELPEEDRPPDYPPPELP